MTEVMKSLQLNFRHKMKILNKTFLILITILSVLLRFVWINTPLEIS